MNVVSKVVATFFGVGYFPAAPGTAATAAGVGLIVLLKDIPFVQYSGLLFLLFAAGLVCSSYLEKALNQKDPGIVVIDEVVGIMIALMGLPLTWPVIVCGFFLFRALDMFKIYPINRFEAMPGGWGVMLDDVMAGLYTNIILSIAVRWAGL